MDKQLDLLVSEIGERIKGIEGRRKHYRNHSFFTFISTTLLATISTLLLGFNFENYKEEIRITVLVITSLITIISAYNTFFNYKELWVANNDALNRFKELSFNIEFFKKGDVTIDQTKLNEFKNQYQSILNELNQVWYKSRLDNK